MISPQGYNLGEEPKSKNPFWDGEGEDSDVNRIYATATVDENVGTPSVQTTKSIDGHDITFGFEFHNLKGRDGTNGANGQDGVSPTITVTDITGGHRVSITDASGTHAFNVMNGTDGQDGRNGTNGTDGRDGTDGVSPSVSVSDITGGHRITVTDATGSETFDVMNGTDGTNGTNGQDGVSPTVTVTDITGGHQVSITDAQGTQTFDVMNGTDGRDGTNGQGVPAGGTAGQVLAKVDGTDYNTEWVTPSGGAELLLEATESSVNLFTLLSSLSSKVNKGDLLYITLGSYTVTPIGPDASPSYKVLSIPWSGNSLSWGSQARVTEAVLPNLWRVISPTRRWRAEAPYHGYYTEGRGEVTEMAIFSGQDYANCYLSTSMFTSPGEQLKINSVVSGEPMMVQMVTGPIKVWRIVKAA